MDQNPSGIISSLHMTIFYNVKLKFVNKFNNLELKYKLNKY